MRKLSYLNVLLIIVLLSYLIGSSVYIRYKVRQANQEIELLIKDLEQLEKEIHKYNNK